MRKQYPMTCPRCKSRFWNVPKIRPVVLGKGLGIEEILGPHRREILRLARKYGAKDIRVFGSVRRREATRTSDVDLLVVWKRGTSPLARFDLETALESVVGRTVQVAATENIPWTFRPEVEAEAVRW
jgi:predicted nucleotidyltransferase